MGSEEILFLGESLPELDAEEVEELYRHFLLDDMPEDDDGDEDFEPPPVDEEEEGEEAGVRRRNVQARELNDLMQDAHKQLGPSVISPGLRERVLDQLSMHFQLLVQTGILAKASPACGGQETASLGMLLHLACGKRGKQALRTRSRGRTTPVCWDPDGEGLPPVGIPGLLPSRTLRDDITEARSLHHSKGNLQATIERLMTSRGAVVWPQLLPSKMLGNIWHLEQERNRETRTREDSPSVQTPNAGAEELSPTSRGFLSTATPGFSMVEDRLLCRGIHLHSAKWDTIKSNFLPHKPTETLMHRYAVLSGWASVHGATQAEPVSKVCTVLWTQQEDLELRSAVQKYGKKWAQIARYVFPKRGRASLRSRWGVLEERLAVGNSGGLFHDDTDGGVESNSNRHAVSFQALHRCLGSQGVGAHSSGLSGGVERSVASLHTRTETSSPSAPSETPHGIAFAEDALSDESERCSDVQWSQGNSSHVHINKPSELPSVGNSLGIAHVGHRYEENELSDNGLDSLTESS